LWSSDLNLVYYFSNRYRDDSDFRWKSRLGLSLSRFFADWELHVEALGQLGTTRRFVDPGIVAGMAPSGPITLDTVLPERDRASTRPVAKVIVGTRRTFRDESTLSIEYYYQSDGYSKGEFQDYVRLLSQARALGLLTQLGLSSATSAGNGGLPVKFSFDPLRGHYLIAGYSRPRIADDWTVGLTVIVGLEDLSGTVSPMVSWQPREWLTVSATGFVPFYGLPVGTVCAVAPGADGRCPDAQSYSEYKLVPQDFRALLQARLYY